MPPKKKDDKQISPEMEGKCHDDPAVFIQNYQKFCKYENKTFLCDFFRLIGLAVNPVIAKNAMTKDGLASERMVLDNEFGQLGPGGLRALKIALMGNGPGMKSGVYRPLKSLCIWEGNCGDDGAFSMADLLSLGRLGEYDLNITSLDLTNNNIGPRGANALGESLAYGKNLSLISLTLNHNNHLGVEGNITLEELNLQYCNIGAAAGDCFAEVLSNPKSALISLDLSGNHLGGAGLNAICKGLMVNSKLEVLKLADNMIDQLDEDLDGLIAFRDCLLCPTVNLNSIDLMYNRIGEAGARILAEGMGPQNTKVKEFCVDVTMPMELFELISRKSGGGGKGKKGKGKKK